MNGAERFIVNTCQICEHIRNIHIKDTLAGFRTYHCAWIS